MANLIINPTADARIFPCPNCRETINTSVSKCPFCAAAIDPGAAETAADLMKRVNQACSDASYLRIMAGSLMVSFFVSFAPIVGLVASVAAWFLLFAVPVMAIRWWIKFGTARSDDREFRQAKKTTAVAVGIWALFFVIMVVLSALSRVSH